MQEKAKCFDTLIADGLCPIIYHIIKILVAHTQLLIEPVFGFALGLQKWKNIQFRHTQSPHYLMY